MNPEPLSKHHCHWPGCRRGVPPKMWGCRAHWFTLPADLRRRIWAAYVPGQEETKTPSQAYLQVADEAQRWALQFDQARRDLAQQRALG